MRVQFEESTGFIVSEGAIEEGATAYLNGVGVRVIANGAWGFCSMDNVLSKPKIREVVDRAIGLANQSARGTTSPVKMAPTRPVRIKIIDENCRSALGEQFVFEDVLETGKECDRRIKSVGDEIQTSSLSFTVGRFIETFSSSEGSLITQAYSGYLGTLYVIASSLGTIEYYPHDFGGLGDYRKFLMQDLPVLTEDMAKKACQLTKSKALPETATHKTVVIDPGFAALLVHETIGHPLEADRVLGGRGDPQNAPWTYNMIGTKVADECFNVVDDSSIRNPAFFRYDSEGVEARKRVLIEHGVIRGCIHNRETAAAFQVEPNGGARSPSYHFIPMPRMSNTYIECGDWTLEEIIRDTKDGLYVVGGITPSVDSRAYEWKISAKESFRVSKGEVKEMLRNTVVSEITPDFLISMDAIAKNLQITITPDCGKGSPIQMLPVGNGGPSIRGKAFVAGVE